MEVSIRLQNSKNSSLINNRVPLPWNPIYKELKKILNEQKKNDLLKVKNVKSETTPDS